jgi:excisionase family DNA binding protein
MQDQKLTYKQVSEFYGIPLGTLYLLVFQKRIPHIRLGKRFVRFSTLELDAWMKNCSVEAREGAR